LRFIEYLFEHAGNMRYTLAKIIFRRIIMKKILTASCAVLLSLSSVGMVHAASDQDVVYDERNNVPVNTFGNCVRTKWMKGDDICAPAQPAPPVPAVVAPAPQPPAPPAINREARTVYFDFNKSTLTPDAITKLNTLIAHISSSKNIIGAGIAGYADRIGSNDYNLELSKKRAKVVYDYLSQRVKINTQILDIRAVGENAPVTECGEKSARQEQIACLARDRRVEVVFQYQE
jgi:OmpA-OmpF porin, OOP family